MKKVISLQQPYASAIFAKRTQLIKILEDESFYYEDDEIKVRRNGQTKKQAALASKLPVRCWADDFGFCFSNISSFSKISFISLIICQFTTDI